MTQRTSIIIHFTHSSGFVSKLLLLLSLFLASHALSFSQASSTTNNAISTTAVLHTMKKATRFMMEKVSYKGGFVWSYMPDFSRRWGEMEAYPSMIWIQAPGTASVGHVLLDAFHATNDDYYLKAAMEVASALIAAQHPSGGWNYFHDFNGVSSVKDWHKTIGANGWRLEEFHHYSPNATFDDGCTIEAATLLLRLFVANNNQFIKTALDQSIAFVLNSQYTNGGWPQRFPIPKNSNRDLKYTANITFNDDVAVKNILFLILCYNEFGDDRLLQAIEKGMDSYVSLQLPKPQPAWALQYSPQGKPAAARSYEPACLSTKITENNIYQLMYFYGLTGDKKFLARVPEAIDWLDELQLPDSMIHDNRTHPAYIELKTNKALYIHRKGSNACNGKYYCDYIPKKTLSHYGSTRTIDVKNMRKSYNKLISSNPDLITANSVLKNKMDLPLYFSRRNEKSSDLNSREYPYMEANTENVTMLLRCINSEGYWPTNLKGQSNPYIGKAQKKGGSGDYCISSVGDKYDTSPFLINDTETKGISTGVFVKNMNLLIEFILSQNNTNP